MGRRRLDAAVLPSDGGNRISTGTHDSDQWRRPHRHEAVTASPQGQTLSPRTRRASFVAESLTSSVPSRRRSGF